MATVRHYSGVRQSISIDLILSMRAVKEKVRESNKETIQTSRANRFSNLCVVCMNAADLILGTCCCDSTLSYSFLFLFCMVSSLWWRWFSIAHRLPMINSTARGTLRIWAVTLSTGRNIISWEAAGEDELWPVVFVAGSPSCMMVLAGQM